MQDWIASLDYSDPELSYTEFESYIYYLDPESKERMKTGSGYLECLIHKTHAQVMKNYARGGGRRKKSNKTNNPPAPCCPDDPDDVNQSDSNSGSDSDSEPMFDIFG